jgi:hypothetical protein
MFSDTFAGIAPASVPGFVGAELGGATLAIALALWLYPRREASDQALEARTPGGTR